MYVSCWSFPKKKKHDHEHIGYSLYIYIFIIFQSRGITIDHRLVMIYVFCKAT